MSTKKWLILGLFDDRSAFFADLKFCDLTGLEIELKGRSVPLNVVLHPYALYLSGSHLFGTTVKKLFTVSYLKSSFKFRAYSKCINPKHTQQCSETKTCAK